MTFWKTNWTHFSLKIEESDEAILEMLLTDADAERGFRLLMRQYQEKLYWLVRRMVLEHEDANDVVQNTFIKVYRNIHNFKGNAKLYTWLYRIATNEAISFLEQKNKKRLTSLDEEGSIIGQQLRADTYFDGDEVQIRLQQAVAQLPEKQRMVFNLRYFEEMSYEEMSGVLETSVGALKASYHHAAKKIEAFFSEPVW